jgi:NTE family protein
MAVTDSSASPCTAFVLAGGGSLGAVEVGMLQALLAWGVTPSLLVGSSAGAINAAYFAADPTRNGVENLRRLWCTLRRRDVFPLDVFGVVFGLFSRRDHLVDSRGLRALLRRHLAYERLEDAAIPIHIVASDMLTGQEVLLSTGPVVEAVLASAAIPGVFPPVSLDSRMLVDGGIANNTPISTAIALGAERIIVLPTGFACALSQPPGGPVARAMHAISLLVARQLVRDAEQFAGNAVELRIVPTLCPLGTSPYDFSAASELIDRSRARTERWLEAGGMVRANVPSELREHGH